MHVSGMGQGSGGVAPEVLKEAKEKPNSVLVCGREFP